MAIRAARQAVAPGDERALATVELATPNVGERLDVPLEGARPAVARRREIPVPDGVALAVPLLRHYPPRHPKEAHRSERPGVLALALPEPAVAADARE